MTNKNTFYTYLCWCVLVFSSGVGSDSLTRMDSVIHPFTIQLILSGITAIIALHSINFSLKKSIFTPVWYNTTFVAFITLATCNTTTKLLMRDVEIDTTHGIVRVCIGSALIVYGTFSAIKKYRALSKDQANGKES